MAEQFTKEESKQIIDGAFALDDALERQIEDEGLDPSVVFEVALLGAAIFACGTDLDDDSIVDSFRESVQQARAMMAESEDEDEACEEEDDD